MDYYKSEEDVRCAKCGNRPKHIIFDDHFDYDGNDRVHEYGKYTCQCGDYQTFSTNDPYENEDHDY